jgi:hypothetical protein
VRRIILFVTILVLGAALVGEAAGAAGSAQHAAYSHRWGGITFVTGLDSCPLFGSSPNPFYAFDDVDLTDHINSKYTPVTDPFFQIDSVGTVNGVINTTRGAFTVAGGGFKEHRVDQLDPLYFSGSGAATISGPGGTVTGRAIFQDLTDFPPPEFDLFFTSITSCHLK